MRAAFVHIYSCSCRGLAFAAAAGFACVAYSSPVRTATSATMADDENFVRIAERARIADIMDVIAAKTESNCRRIISWEGSYRFDERRLATTDLPVSSGSNWDGKPYWCQVKGISRFALDTMSDSAYMTYEPGLSIYTSATNGSQIDFRVTCPKEIEVITPEHHLALRPNIDIGPLPQYPSTTILRGPVAYRRAPGPRYMVVEVGGRLVDPMVFFGNGVRPVWDWCGSYARKIRDGTFDDDLMSRLQLSCNPDKSNTLYRLRVAYISNDDERPGSTYTYTFSESEGLNITAYQIERAGVVVKTVELLFEYSNEIFYPREVNVHGFDSASGIEMLNKRYTIEDCVFNKPIDRKLFTWQGICPPEGTRIVDEIEGTMTAYQNGNLIDPEEFIGKSDIRSSASSGSRSLVMWINVLAVVLLFCAIVAKRFVFCR